MIHRDKYSDERYDGVCCYCGSYGDTEDHVPSKVLLDEEFPENMHKVDCCLECNQGFSADEVYFACLIECIIHGSADPEKLERPKIKRILSEKEHLRRRISDCMIIQDGTITFQPDQEAVEHVLMKLARGHAAFEASKPQFSEPSYFCYKPVELMSEKETEDFFSEPEADIYPEVGSRLFHQMVITKGTPFSSWVTVQENVYAYLVISQVSRFSVRLLIWNYLAAEVIWED